MKRRREEKREGNVEKVEGFVLFAMWAVATLVFGGSCPHNATLKTYTTHTRTMEWSRFACRLPHGPLSFKDGIAPPPGALSSFCCDEIREGNGSGGGGGGALRGLRLAQDINAMSP